jgi:hypothetical protein
MRTRTVARTAALALLAVGLALMGKGLYSRRAAARVLTDRAGEPMGAEAGIRRMQDQIEAAERTPPPSRSPGVAPVSAAKPSVARPDPALGLLASHPKLLDLFLKSFRASLGQRYGVFYTMRALSPEQIARFEDFAAKHQETVIDLASAAASQGMVASDPTIATLRQQADDQMRAGQLALLGDADYRQLQEFDRAQKALALINGAAQFALDSADAYTYAQAGQLMQILARASPRFQQGGSFDPTGVDWDSAVAQAAPLLSPPQLEALKGQAQAMKLMSRLKEYTAQRPGL